MKTILNTKDCYEGKNILTDELVSGNILDLYKNEEIKADTIVWSNLTYEDEKKYFMDFLQTLIESYEKRYHTTVDFLGLVGSVGRWNGRYVNGQIIGVDKNPIEYLGDVDDIEVTIDTDGVIRIHGYHHDGLNTMNLYLLTENKLNKVAPGYLIDGECNPTVVAGIYINLKPLKCGETGIQYYGAYSA